MAEGKKLVTSTNRALLYFAVISWVITAILFFSGFKKINPYLLAAVLIFAVVLIYYLLRKPKVYDIYKIIDELSSQHFQKYKMFLDTRDFQVIPITPGLSYIHLPKAGVTAYFENGRVTGMETNHIYRVIRRQEKSKLFTESLKYLSRQAVTEKVAEALNIEIE